MIGRHDYVGQQIGNYQVVKLLGSGSFGTVYLARNKHVATHIVAIKLMNANFVGSEKERQDFLHEASLLVMLRHPHILPILDFGILDTHAYESIPYMVTEYAANGSLRDRLRQQAANRLPLSEALAILSQVGQALYHAHKQNIVHRDLKPENILFNAQGEVLLADFGIATELPSSTVRNAATITGTPSYMAPEQFEGTVSKLSDQYALGCIAYELVTGQRPFSAGNFAVLALMHANETPTPPRQFNPSLPVYVEQAILKAMAKERAQRFPDVNAFTSALGISQPNANSPLTPIPPPPPSPTTITTALNGPSGHTEIGPTGLTIGRAPDNQHVLNDSQVSGHHAMIRMDGQTCTITDLKSTNGTFVNEQRLLANVPRTLVAGDKLRLGTTTFTYEVNNLPQIAKTVWAKPDIFEPPKPLPPQPKPGEPPAKQEPARPQPQPYPVSQQPAGGKTKKSGRWIAPLVIVTILILVAVVAIPTVNHYNQIASENATATSEASDATATATALQDLYDSSTNGTPALNDSLSSSSGNGWDENSNCFFTGGTYHITVSQQGYLNFCTANSASTFSNFAYQVQMTVVNGDEGAILFRTSYVNSNWNYYLFYVNQNGTYGFAVGGNGHYTTQYNDSSSAIHTGTNQSNLVAVVAQGETFTFYINKEFVWQTTNTTYSQGSIGVGALDTSNSTEVACSLAQVWTV